MGGWSDLGAVRIDGSYQAHTVPFPFVGDNRGGGMTQLDVAGFLLRRGQEAGGVQGHVQFRRDAHKEAVDWLIDVVKRVANAENHLVVLRKYSNPLL